MKIKKYYKLIGVVRSFIGPLVSHLKSKTFPGGIGPFFLILIGLALSACEIKPQHKNLFSSWVSETGRWAIDLSQASFGRYPAVITVYETTIEGDDTVCEYNIDVDGDWIEGEIFFQRVNITGEVNDFVLSKCRGGKDGEVTATYQMMGSTLALCFNDAEHCNFFD